MADSRSADNPAAAHPAITKACGDFVYWLRGELDACWQALRQRTRGVDHSELGTVPRGRNEHCLTDLEALVAAHHTGIGSQRECDEQAIRALQAHLTGTMLDYGQMSGVADFLAEFRAGFDRHNAEISVVIARGVPGQQTSALAAVWHEMLQYHNHLARLDEVEKRRGRASLEDFLATNGRTVDEDCGVLGSLFRALEPLAALTDSMHGGAALTFVSRVFCGWITDRAREHERLRDAWLLLPQQLAHLLHGEPDLSKLTPAVLEAWTIHEAAQQHAPLEDRNHDERIHKWARAAFRAGGFEKAKLGVEHFPQSLSAFRERLRLARGELSMLKRKRRLRPTTNWGNTLDDL